MIQQQRVIVMDIDGTLCSRPLEPGDYRTAKPYKPVVNKLKKLKKDGFYIVLQTSRQMRTFEGNAGKINAFMLPVLVQWLCKYEVPYDEIHVGKPWCGQDGFYVDDKAIRPSEFLSMNHNEILNLLDREKEAQGKLDECYHHDGRRE